MAIPNIYIVKNSSGAIQVAELVGGGTINQIGADVFANTSEVLSTVDIFTNRVVEYRGEIYVMFYSSATTSIYGYNRGTGLWTFRHSLSSLVPMGLFLINTSSVQRLAAVGIASGQAYILYTDGSGWTTSAALGSAGTTNRCPAIEFNNKLYFPITSSGSKILEVDPIGITITLITPPFVGSNLADQCVDLCVYDDRLFCLTPGPVNAGFSGSDWELYEFVGGNFTLNTSVTNTNDLGAIGAARQGQPSLFQDPSTGRLIAICNGSNNGTTTGTGSRAFELTPSGAAFTVNEITDPVIPAGFRPGVRGNSGDHAEDRWLCYVSNDDTPASPEVFLFFAIGPAPGTGFTTYTWNGVGSVITSLAAGPNTNYAMPHQKFGGGGRVNRASANQCTIELATPVSGAYRISYRVYGTVATQSVRLYYDLDQDTPSTQATISAQTGGSGISGGNTVTGITGDDGTTLFTLDWDLVTDGVSNGDAAHLMLDIR